MAGNVQVTVTGTVEGWPQGFLQNLPSQDWLVLHCLPRQEKKLAAELKVRGIPGCIFFERRVRRYPGKGVQESLVPLLGSYLFVVASALRKDAIYDTKRVLRIIDVPRPAELANDLKALTLLVGSAQGPLVVRPEIIAGMRVAITVGTFAGCEGIVVRRQGLCELVVNIPLLGTSVAVNLPAEAAEPVLAV